MKHWDNVIGPVKRPKRRSMAALLAANRVGCDFHGKEFFADFRRQFDDVSTKAGVSAEQYRDWLQANGQADTISSRHRYLFECDRTCLP